MDYSDLARYTCRVECCCYKADRWALSYHNAYAFFYLCAIFSLMRARSINRESYMEGTHQSIEYSWLVSRRL